MEERLQKLISQAKIESSHEVTIVRISISERINEIVDLLRLKRRITFMELFEGMHTKGQLVMTFIAMLEMAKLGLTKIHQTGQDGEIYISATDSIDESIDELTQSLNEDEYQ